MKCAWPTCNEQSISGDYCFQHGRVYGRKTVEKKPVVIPKKSEKAKKETPEYIRFVKEYLNRKENKVCNIQAPGCTFVATAINHRKRRFKDTKMNEEFIEPCCASCNIYIEQNDSWARERGHLLSKFK